jgi:hypothetical protein
MQVGGQTMKQEMKRANSFPLRLTPTMRQQMELLAKREGVSLNQFISLAVAEKVMRMEGYAKLQKPILRPPLPITLNPSQLAEKLGESEVL